MVNESRLAHFLFKEYETRPSSLAIYRILYATSVLAIYLPQHLWIASFPNSFFNPPVGLTIFFVGFPPAVFFVLLDGFSILAAWFLLLGYRTRLAAITLAVLLLIGNAWSYSFGKINNDIFLILIPLVLQFSGWGDSYSFDARRKSRVHSSCNAWPLALLALLIGFAMMTAAYGKATTGWLSPWTHAVLGNLLRNAFVIGRANWLTTLILHVKSGPFWELLDWGTVLLEAAFLFAVGSRQMFRIVCALGCLFHFSIALTMGIPFWPNVVAYGAFCDWSVLESRTRVRTVLDSWKTLTTRLSALKLAVFGSVVSVVYVTLGNPLQRLATLVIPREPDSITGVPPVLAGAIVASIFLVGEFRRAFNRPGINSGLHPIILFDGFCGLCNSWVDFVLKHDRGLLYRFTALQSSTGQNTLERLRLPKDFIHSLVLVEGDRAYYSSSAILRILRAMGLPFSIAYVCILVPRQIRDQVYALVADHRYRFGKRSVCRIPTPEEQSRFI
jgi:predicted DCC family thiol-disulfide oxidoreductase YuxK/uncharacterized membrane protein YphA (DoxX/SURF4 family)